VGTRKQSPLKLIFDEEFFMTLVINMIFFLLKSYLFQNLFVTKVSVSGGRRTSRKSKVEASGFQKVKIFYPFEKKIVETWLFVQHFLFVLFLVNLLSTMPR
jgi:hypothetical protein